MTSPVDISPEAVANVTASLAVEQPRTAAMMRELRSQLTAEQGHSKAVEQRLEEYIGYLAEARASLTARDKDAKDAARYRWLLCHRGINAGGGPPPTGLRWVFAEDMTKYIDAAMEKANG